MGRCTQCRTARGPCCIVGLMKSVSRRRPSKEGDEPGIEPEMGWVEAGGELILAAGFTEAGFPYGISVDEYRDANFRDDSRAGWARAKHAIDRVCSSALGRDVEVGFVKRLGTGLSRDAYRATIDEGRQPLDVYALVPNRFAAPDYDRRAVFELKLLAALGKRELAFRVPKVFGALRDHGGVILVEELLEGVPLDLVADSRADFKPWEAIGEIAAEIHSLPAAELPPGLLEPRDCRSHGEATLATLSGDHPLLHRARDWMVTHLPPHEPGVLLHGDLLGQNIHLGFDAPPGVLDWERAEVGDPAYELAVVTRGTRRPFKREGGLKLLVDAYAEAGGRPLTLPRVHFFEVFIVAVQLERALDEGTDVQGAEERLRALLKRLGA